MSADDSNGQDSMVIIPLFNPTLEISIRGQNDRDLLYQILGSLTAAHETGHESVSISVNSSYVYHAINFWSYSWMADAKDSSDGVWRDLETDQPIVHQQILEAILKYREKLEMRVFLCGPLI